MARYFNPPSFGAIVAAGGRPIDSALHRLNVAELRTGEALLWHIARRGERLAIDVTDLGTYRDLRNQQIYDGGIELLGCYAIPASALSE